MSAFLDALRSQLEPDLVCRCGLKNTAHVRVIRIIDAHAHALCACGIGGPVQMFQQE